MAPMALKGQSCVPTVVGQSKIVMNDNSEMNEKGDPSEVDWQTQGSMAGSYLCETGRSVPVWDNFIV